ncbi:MAG: glycosyltransferase family 9 protein [Candidatus Omnitrophica bacterium]|nr:glycosyltransferase family 9 protein [Candidatus Omnitrophota bacterium]
MFFRVSDKSKVRKILVISLSNIGDVVLTLPVVDILLRDFPDAAVSVVVGPKAESLLRDNPVLAEVIVLDKHQSRSALWTWVAELRRRKFDMVIDLRNSMIPFMLMARYMTPPEMRRVKGQHMRRKHLARLSTVHQFTDDNAPRRCLTATASDAGAVDALLGGSGSIVVMAPGSADQAKRWSPAGFAAVAKYLKSEYDLGIVFLGDRHDQEIAARITAGLDVPVLDLCGRTTLSQSAEIVRRAAAAVVNDSAVLHLAGYHNIPTVALFGYTDPVKYGPWSEQRVIVAPQGAPLPKDSSTARKVAYIESIPPEAVISRLRYTDGRMRLVNE